MHYGAVLSFCAGILIAAPAVAFDGLQQVEEYWLSKGADPHVAKAWAAEVNRESGGNPMMVGDGGSSIGAYQHHLERAATLLLNIENDQAFHELMEDDPIAANHRDEILRAPTQAAAQAAIKKYFFRPASSGALTGNSRITRAAIATNQMPTQQKREEPHSDRITFLIARLSANSDVYSLPSRGGN